MRIKYHPIFSTHFDVGVHVSAEDIRRDWPNTVWAFDPYLGTTRSIADVQKDPQGLQIEPPTKSWFDWLQTT